MNVGYVKAALAASKQRMRLMKQEVIEVGGSRTKASRLFRALVKKSLK